MHYLGADLSLTGTGLVVIDQSCSILLQKLLEYPKGASGVERLFFLRSALQEVLSNTNPSYCCIEGPSYGSKQGKLFEIGEWAGVFKLELYTRSIPFIIAVPSQLKKYVSGTGKSVGKSLVILDVFKNFKVELRNDNIADAYVLARIMRDYTSLLEGDELTVKQYQREVLVAIRKSHSISSLLE